MVELKAVHAGDNVVYDQVIANGVDSPAFTASFAAAEVFLVVGGGTRDLHCIWLCPGSYLPAVNEKDSSLLESFTAF